VTEQNAVARELAMIKVSTNKENRSAVIEIVDVFRAKIVDVAVDVLVVEATGTEDKIDALINMLQPHGIKELVRTGRVAMVRGGAQTVSAPSRNGQERHYRSAGEGKPKVGSLI
jgi:acetolactate synthase-1/3 small subunit